MSHKRGSFSTKLVDVKDCPKYLPGFGAGAGVCRRCKSPASQHGRNFEKEAKEMEATEREEEKAKGGKEQEEKEEEKEECEEKGKPDGAKEAKLKKDLRLRLTPTPSVLGFTDDRFLVDLSSLFPDPTNLLSITH